MMGLSDEFDLDHIQLTQARDEGFRAGVDAALADLFALAVDDSWPLDTGVRVVGLNRLAEIVALVNSPGQPT